MKAKDIFIPVALGAVAIGAAALAVTEQNKERARLEEACRIDPAQCPAPQDKKNDAPLIVPLPGGGVGFF